MRAHIGAEVTSAAGWRFPVLVETRAGYQNLCRLITRMKLRARKGEGHVSDEEVGERAAGLICLTGGKEGPLEYALTRGGVENGIAHVRQLCEIFGRGNVYVELQRHFDRAEEARNHAAVEIARKLGLPLLATNGVCYAQPERREVLDVFTCLRHHRTLETAGRLLGRNSERYLKSPEEMARLFADLPEAIANTQLVSARLQFDLQDLGYEFPKYPVSGGKSQAHFLRERTLEGMIYRYGPDNEKARAQIDAAASPTASRPPSGAGSRPSPVTTARSPASSRVALRAVARVTFHARARGRGQLAVEVAGHVIRSPTVIAPEPDPV